MRPALQVPTGFLAKEEAKKENTHYLMFNPCELGLMVNELIDVSLSLIGWFLSSCGTCNMW